MEDWLSEIEERELGKKEDYPGVRISGLMLAKLAAMEGLSNKYLTFQRLVEKFGDDPHNANIKARFQRMREQAYRRLQSVVFENYLKMPPDFMDALLTGGYKGNDIVFEYEGFEINTNRGKYRGIKFQGRFPDFTSFFPRMTPLFWGRYLDGETSPHMQTYSIKIGGVALPDAVQIRVYSPDGFRDFTTDFFMPAIIRKSGAIIRNESLLREIALYERGFD